MDPPRGSKTSISFKQETIKERNQYLKMKKEAPQLNQVVLFHHAFSALFEEISELLRVLTYSMSHTV